jgi:hypothetical protein
VGTVHVGPCGTGYELELHYNHNEKVLMDFNWRTEFLLLCEEDIKGGQSRYDMGKASGIYFGRLDWVTMA